MGRHFPVREKSGNFEQTGKSGKITQNTGKLGEFEINIIDILSDIKMNCVLFAKMDQVFSLKKLSIKKILENGKKYWKSQGILSVRKSGNPACGEHVACHCLVRAPAESDPPNILHTPLEVQGF